MDEATSPIPNGLVASPTTADRHYDRVIYRCVIGSRAYGLDVDASDTDRRGVYLPPAELHWSLYGVPEQLENDATQECCWELQKFIMLTLKANPNVLECLCSPIVESVTTLGKELLALRDAFLSKLVLNASPTNSNLPTSNPRCLNCHRLDRSSMLSHLQHACM